MKIQQILYHEGVFAPQKTDEGFVESAVNLVLVFAQRIYFESHPIHVELKKKFANAEIVYCSSAGNIIDNKFVVNKIVINAIAFEKTTIKVAEVTVENSEDSFAAGEEILQQLNTENELKGILFFTDGSRVNGTSFIAGINNKNIHTVGASGGMAGDDANFCRTLVGLNHDPKEGKIVAIGFYGESISFGYSSVGG